ncbi:carboxypeptidase-like regulatory domain-containing protein [Aureliella helgolandensis]|uniref:Carboxypeptidase regulatory-like domain-containing protein n=1 Tax=Aureliella helgolandensis TaxID=2527968 RepID=A0A518GC06_9BACT|nr:carboxypeptidase-like regulatory domain-containing protein [Aureliella helgolandensis]QDV26114.1 hypothetical protein Q31a_44860 [Aureliella helgolandensis]
MSFTFSQLFNAPTLRALLVLVLLSAVGCGEPDFYTMKGTATHDGVPIPNLQITFAPEAIDSTRPPVTITKVDGTFEMTTGRNRGIPPGKYTIHIEDPGAADGRVTPKKDDSYYDAYMYVVERYSPANSDLNYDAKQHASGYELKLDTKDPSKPLVKNRTAKNTTDNP